VKCSGVWDLGVRRLMRTDGESIIYSVCASLISGNLLPAIINHISGNFLPAIINHVLKIICMRTGAGRGGWAGAARARELK
jgi:hypothetical protein